MVTAGPADYFAYPPHLSWRVSMGAHGRSVDLAPRPSRIDVDLAVAFGL